MSIVKTGVAQTFPSQKRTRKQKDEAFYKACVDIGEVLFHSTDVMGLRASLQEKISNINLYNDIVDPKEVKRVINAYNVEGNFNAEYRNYPLANPYINNLIGEERKRFFNPIVTLVNSDLINTKLNVTNDMLNEFLVQQILSNKQLSEERLSQEINTQAKWVNFNYRDRRERMASQIIQYGFATQGFKEKFSRSFEDLLLAGEELVSADIIAGEPVLNKMNPLHVYTVRSGNNSNKIEDSDIIFEISYIPIGQAIDEYHDELKSSQIKKLEEGYGSNISATSKLFERQLRNEPFSLESWIDEQGGIGPVITATKKLTSFFGGGFDEYGNVRKMRTLWKGMRKVGVLSYFDEVGDLQKKYVDEDYPIDELNGESVKWIWISEWYEGTKLADDIYLKMGPRPVQFRAMDNPSKCAPGIVGTIFNVNNSTAKSLMSLIKPYQLMYNFFMHKLWEEMRTYKGKIAKIQTSLIPDGWTMDEFLFYLDQMKIIFEDPFNAAKEGVATGKLAGTMNQSGGSVEIGDPGMIKQLLEILSFIEMRLQDVTGITPQRKGAIEQRETVGGVERAVTQSTLNTEKYFGVHDNFRLRAVEAYLETAKVAWKDQKFKRQFILDDGSQSILDFDGELFAESEYGVHITTATSDMEMMNTLKSLTQPFLQNGGSLSMVMDLYRTKDPASLQRKLERYEQEVQQREQQQIQAQLQAQEKELAEKTRLEEARIALERENNIRDNETKLQSDAMKANVKAPEVEKGGENVEKPIERDKLKEVIRSNKANEALKEKDLAIRKKIANKPKA